MRWFKRRKPDKKPTVSAVVSKFSQRPTWMLLVPAIIILAGAGTGAVLFVVNHYKTPSKKTTSKVTLSPQQLAKQVIAASEKQQQAAAQRPTDSQRLASILQDLAKPNLSQGDQYQDYSDAALLAAGLNKPEAKIYAQKALALFPKDTDPRTDTRAAEQGLIDKLTAISKGDYSVVPK